MKFLRNQSLKKHTSFKIGGWADYFCIPKTLADLQAALAFAKEKKLKVAILGAGTNTLILDHGFKGLVVKLAGGLDQLSVQAGQITVGAGVSLSKLLQSLANKGYGGLEFLAGIPGTVGGAVYMNAGAWGKQIGRLVQSVTIIDRQGNIQTLGKNKLKFGYRASGLQKFNAVIAEVTLKLRRQKKNLVLQTIKEYLEKRRAKQPLGSPNCGSVFKNPKGDFAGRLIEAAGCKGLRIGDAQVCPKHANFIVNLGEAKAKDVVKLMTKIQQAVKTRFKIRLEPEIKIMVN